MSGADAARRRALIGTAAAGAAIVLGLPLAVVFAEAFRQGWLVYVRNILQPDTLHAVALTALAAIVVVPINIGFGISAAWLVTRFRFPGRRLLVTIIDLPFSISPIVAGVAYLFVYGARGVLGPTLQSAGISVMFTVWAIFLVSLFVTAPFVARELIPLMETQGTDEEEAAVGLGASGLQTFMRVTLPRIKWALIYGAILCNARVMGEFGAVSVVSGNIRGVTNTLPLQVELLYNDYNAAGAFAAASVLALLAIVTLVLKVIVERRDPMLQVQRTPLRGAHKQTGPH